MNEERIIQLTAAVENSFFIAICNFLFQDSPRMRTKEGKRRMSVQDKISHFFSKIKSSSKRHQSASDGDLPSTSKGHKVHMEQFC